jgi:hypothetical protein
LRVHVGDSHRLTAVRPNFVTPTFAVYVDSARMTFHIDGSFVWLEWHTQHHMVCRTSCVPSDTAKGSSGGTGPYTVTASGIQLASDPLAPLPTAPPIPTAAVSGTWAGPDSIRYEYFPSRPSWLRKQ